ncbi:MAG: MoaF C-terminal domain-containing protein [Microbacterium sp.]|uniref:MoaF C-terminal domain-containing protein n=1 Tax=Microbacterium sp. TaxID=51671 RepID=UPI003BAFF219
MTGISADPALDEWRTYDEFAAGLYQFCFREFRIAVASVWLHDLGHQLMTTGIFLGLNDDDAEHSRGGGHISPLGSVAHSDVQPA